jgi:hypothetical protein
LLIFARDGRAQWRSPSGRWGAVFQLATQQRQDEPSQWEIRQIRPDAEGLLLTEGSSKNRSGTVSLLGPDGTLKDRWAVADYSAADNKVYPGMPRQITTRSGALALLPKGVLQPVFTFPASMLPPAPGSAIFHAALEGGDHIACHGSVLSKQGHTPLSCQRIGARPWAFSEGTDLTAAPLCGPHLLVQGGPSGTKLPTLIVKDLRTGQTSTAKPVDARSDLMACDEGRGVLVTNQQWLAYLELPTLRERWRLKLPKPHAIAQLGMVWPGQVFYQLEGPDAPIRLLEAPRLR